MTACSPANGYPVNWAQISLAIRERDGGQCECTGQCGLHHEHRCVERNGELAQFARGRIMLTVAHLNHDPSDSRDENLIAACQRCHLRIDGDQHQANARKTRRAQKAVGDLFE